MPHTICTAILALLFSASFSHAQTRTYSCAKGNAITLTVIAPNAIKAGPIEGGTMRLKQSAGDPLRFSDGDYAVQISPDQSQITVEIPDWGSAKCSFRPQVAAQDGRAGLGNADPCGPGFHQAPQTDRCDPNEAHASRTNPGWLPMAGMSLGGIMRSAPSMSSPKLASLTEKSGITLLERAGAMDGYDWFKIEFDGRIGYQWGGIMCSDQAISGILEQCK
ncbi:MAG: SH3 domain-containing protein [Reyranella sp.]|nr:SH3 domain-containing protein [Reyranella sp.]